MKPTAPVLEVKNLTKSFGGLTAVSDVSFSVEAGKIKALIGPNGAGKTTLLNLVSGLYEPTRGTISFFGELNRHRTPHGIAASGVARSFSRTSSSSPT